MADVVTGDGTGSASIAARVFKKEREQNFELSIIDKMYKKKFSYQVSRRFVTQYSRGEFRPRQTRQLPRAVDLKGRLQICQSY